MRAVEVPSSFGTKHLPALTMRLACDDKFAVEFLSGQFSEAAGAISRHQAIKPGSTNQIIQPKTPASQQSREPGIREAKAEAPFDQGSSDQLLELPLQYSAASSEPTMLEDTKINVAMFSEDSVTPPPTAEGSPLTETLVQGDRKTISRRITAIATKTIGQYAFIKTRLSKGSRSDSTSKVNRSFHKAMLNGNDTTVYDLPKTADVLAMFIDNDIPSEKSELLPKHGETTEGHATAPFPVLSLQQSTVSTEMPSLHANSKEAAHKNVTNDALPFPGPSKQDDTVIGQSLIQPDKAKTQTATMLTVSPEPTFANPISSRPKMSDRVATQAQTTVRPSRPMAVDAEVGHTLLRATPSQVEVEIASGNRGLLRVRAELTSEGLVSASLSSDSRSGQRMLHSELSSLATFLRNESVPLGSLSVNEKPPLVTRGDSQFDFKSGTSDRSAERDRSATHTAENGNTRTLNNRTPSIDEDPVLNDLGGRFRAVQRGTSGKWLSVLV